MKKDTVVQLQLGLHSTGVGLSKMNLPQRQSCSTHSTSLFKIHYFAFCSFALYTRVMLLGAGKMGSKASCIGEGLCVFCSFCEGPEAVSVKAVDMEV